MGYHSKSKDRGPNLPRWVATISDDDIHKIISRADSVDLLITHADTIGNKIWRDVTTSQVRGIFGTVRQIQLEWTADATREQAMSAYRKVMLLRPKLGYQAKRANKHNFFALEDILGRSIQEIGQASDDQERRKRFLRFVEFFEAILAYHKKYGGKS